MDSESGQADEQIDRLSRLIPELLSDIFDLAHDPDHPLVEGLSKTLSPFVRRSLYRRTKVSRPDPFRKLIETLRGDPSLVSLIVEADISEDDYTFLEEEDEQDFLSLQGPEPTLSDPDVPLLVRLPFLQSLSFYAGSLTSDNLSRLSGLESLTRLTIRFVDFDHEQPPSLPESSLPSLKELHLSIVEDSTYGWSTGLGKMVERCPSLTHLTLQDGYPSDHGYCPLLSTLDVVRSTLRSLSIIHLSEGDNLPATCDHLLPNFPNLTHLSLRNEAISPSLPIYLRHLPCLVSLKLGYKAEFSGLSAKAVADFLRDPTRSDTLKHLVLEDCPRSKIGRQVDIGASLSTQVRGDCELEEDGWELRQGDWVWGQHEEVEKLIGAAKDTGVLLHGELVDEWRVWHTALLEIANRVILRAHEARSLREYVKKTWEKGFEEILYKRLPELDIEALDLENLKLVKIELPKEGWFQLTLE